MDTLVQYIPEINSEFTPKNDGCKRILSFWDGPFSGLNSLLNLGVQLRFITVTANN